ncbi:MAG: FAD-dependent oxidoreductase [Pseudonocardiaceae bacterium]|nr:FAD-dependent oxidoreductase [Pseudonocardiaceae bacterium]
MPLSPVGYLPGRTTADLTDPTANCWVVAALVQQTRQQGRGELHLTSRGYCPQPRGGHAVSDHADVVVVGGGVQGAAVALHLLEAGVRDVLLLERDEPFEATSGAGAGFVGIWAVAFPTFGKEEVAVEHYGINFYRRLQEQGYDVDFAQNGFLFVGANEESLLGLRGMDRHPLDPDTHLVDGKRVEELTDGVILADEGIAGAYQPAGAHVYTKKVGAAMIARISALGGRIEPRRPVTGLRVRGERIVGVETTTGAVSSDSVVLSAGAWNNELLRPHGAFLPFVPLLTSRIITEPLGVPPSLPAVLLFGATSDAPVLWIRQHEGGLLWGGVYMNHPRDTLLGLDKLPTRFDETPIDGVLECQRAAAGASRFMPAFGRYRSMTLKHGAPCYTPDSRALVGSVPGIEGLYAIAGDNEGGITHGPGFGKALADHLVHGFSELTHLDAWQLDRFDGQYTTDVEVAAAVNADSVVQQET